MDKETRKKLQEQYSTRKAVGGVYAICSSVSGKRLILSTTDMQGSQNRFAFAQQTGGCVHPKLQSEWNSEGPEAFSFEVVEELIKKEDQTDKVFMEEAESLCDMIKERYTDEQLY